VTRSGLRSMAQEMCGFMTSQGFRPAAVSQTLTLANSIRMAIQYLRNSDTQLLLLLPVAEASLGLRVLQTVYL
jgi:hypothetical protein